MLKIKLGISRIMIAILLCSIVYLVHISGSAAYVAGSLLYGWTISAIASVILSVVLVVLGISNIVSGVKEN